MQTSGMLHFLSGAQCFTPKTDRLDSRHCDVEGKLLHVSPITPHPPTPLFFAVFSLYFYDDGHMWVRRASFVKTP